MMKLCVDCKDVDLELFLMLSGQLSETMRMTMKKDDDGDVGDDGFDYAQNKEKEA